jgi:hypothetical protein
MKLPALARVAQYSGKYRPAWRMSQTGVWSVAWRRQARRKVSFCRRAKDDEDAVALELVFI